MCMKGPIREREIREKAGKAVTCRGLLELGVC